MSTKSLIKSNKNIIIDIIKKKVDNMMKNDEIKFAERIKELRLSKNMTLQELGDKLGKTKSTISTWENGKRSPKMHEIASIAKVLGVDADYLLGFSDIKNINGIYQKNQNNYWKTIKEENIENNYDKKKAYNKAIFEAVKQSFESPTGGGAYLDWIGKLFPLTILESNHDKDNLDSISNVLDSLVGITLSYSNKEKYQLAYYENKEIINKELDKLFNKFLKERYGQKDNEK